MIIDQVLVQGLCKELQLVLINVLQLSSGGVSTRYAFLLAGDEHTAARRQQLLSRKSKLQALIQEIHSISR